MKRKIVLFFSLVLFGCLPAIAQDCPPNMDFELGNTSVWNYYEGTCCPLNCPLSTPASPGRHTLTTGAGTDFYGGFPIVAPGGGGYSMKLGHDTTNYCAEKATYFIHVPVGVTNYSVIYRYAIVLQDGGSGHTATNQPRFDINAYDSATAAPVSCAQYNYVVSSTIPGFLLSTHPGGTGGTLDVHYKPWTIGSINLSGLGGTTVKIDFSAGGCGLGGHWGYGYLDMSCGLFQISAVGCDDTTATLTAPDGFAGYTWYDSTTFTTLYGSTQTVTVPMPATATTYAVILAPYTGFGCPDTLYTHIVPSHLQLHPSNDTSICFGTGVMLSTGATDIATPLTYSWSPATGLSCTSCATPIATPVVPTAYVFTVTNSVGCTKTDTINVGRGHVTTTITGTNVSCFGYNDGSATVTPVIGTAPYSYNWSTVPLQTNSTATNLVIGTYSVSVTDATGCTGDTFVTLTQPLENIINLVGHTDPTTCGGADGTITINSPNGTLVPGATYTFHYTYNGAPVTVNLTVSAGGTVVITGLVQGTATNINITGTPCPFNVITGPIVLTDPSLPAVPFVSSNSPVCENGTLNLNAADATLGVAYSWTGPNGFTSVLANPVIPNVTLAASGVYSVTVTVNNCVSVGGTVVQIDPLPQPTASNNTPICAGDSIVLTSSSANGSDQYSWSGPPAFSSVLQNPVIHGATVASSGTYTVTMILNGCVAQAFTNVIVNPIPPIPGISDTQYCQFATAIPLSAVGTNLLWYTSLTGIGSPTAPTPSTLVPGTTTWYVNQTSPAGCVGPLTAISVRVYQLAAPYVTLSDTVICKGNKITMNAAGTGEDLSGVTWDFGTGDSILNVNPVTYSFDTVGTFTIRATAYYNVCPDVGLTRSVLVIPYPNTYIGEDTSICAGNSLINLWDHHNSGNPGATWLWSTGETTSSINITTPGFYYVTTTINGCPSSDSITVLNDCYMNLPNVFTPNGDGVNDFFFPRDYLTKGLTAFKMEIYNRWGEIIFSTTKTDGAGWDGKYNGIPQPEGVFIYKMDATFKDGVHEHHQGNFTLLR